VENDTRRLIETFYAAGKPICAICIAPTLLARVLGPRHPRLTIGRDPATSRAIEATGAIHVDCAVDEPCVDDQHRLVTVGAYMFGDAPLAAVAEGIARAVRACLAMVPT
jgi:enhancing lycopene biosynthesis protein 2